MNDIIRSRPEIVSVSLNTDDEDIAVKIRKLLNPKDHSTQTVQEIAIGSRDKREYEDEEPDDNNNYPILGQHLDSRTLARILRNCKSLRIFSWCVNMPIPPTILSTIQELLPNIKLQVLKRQMTDDAIYTPQLDFDVLNSCPLNQVHIDRNDFGHFVYSSSVPRFARLHMLVPYYPASQGETKSLWMSKKTAFALSTLEKLPALSSIYATDYHGEVGLLLAGILKHAATLRSLKLHTQPTFENHRSVLTLAQIEAVAANLTNLTHLEMDIDFNTSGNLLEMPFTSELPTISAVANMPSIRTMKLWIEVPLEESVFQDDYKSAKSKPPPLKDAALLQAVGNLYSLMKTANGNLKLEQLDVAFTRLDSWDRQGAWPRYLPVTLRPSQAGQTTSASDRGFTIEIGESNHDYPEDDVGQFIDRNVGTIH